MPSRRNSTPPGLTAQAMPVQSAALGSSDPIHGVNDNALQGGVIIIGSLFWQYNRDEKEGEKKDILRYQWRNDRLDMSKAVKIRLPLDYGRTSNGNIFTMTMRPTYKVGTGYLVPFKQRTNSIDKLVEEAKAIAKAEGMVVKTKLRPKSATMADKMKDQPEPETPVLIKSWGVIALRFQKGRDHGPIQREAKGEWAKMMISKTVPSEEQKNYQTYHEYFWRRTADPGSWGGVGGGTWNGNKYDYAFDPLGQLTPFPTGCGGDDWFTAVDHNRQSEVNQIDYVLCTVTRPDEKLPSVHDVAVSVIADGSRKYFYNNFHDGITTRRDNEILAAISVIREEKRERADGIHHAFRLRAGECLFSPSAHARLKYDGINLVFSYLGEEVWRSTEQNSELEHLLPSGKRTVASGQIVDHCACFQEDGNLVIYNHCPAGGADSSDDGYWSTRTYRPSGVSDVRVLRLGDERSFQILANGLVKWHSYKCASRHEPVTRLLPGQYLWGENKKLGLYFGGSTLKVKTVTYTATGDESGTKLFPVTQTYEIQGLRKLLDNGGNPKKPNGERCENYVEFQEDGNLVIYNCLPSPGKPDSKYAYLNTGTTIASPENCLFIDEENHTIRIQGKPLWADVNKPKPLPTDDETDK